MLDSYQRRRDCEGLFTLWEEFPSLGLHATARAALFPPGRQGMASRATGSSGRDEHLRLLLWGGQDSRIIMARIKPKCLVCAKPCELSDRNVDGTYAHRECLYANMTYPPKGQ